ncbi:MAG: ABC transporter permease subunit [Promethearchaeota archaeon]
MEIFSVLKFEIKKNYKSILIFATIIGGFLFMMTSIFEPILFANYNVIIVGMPEEVLALIGGLIDLSTFEGYFNMYIFELAWMWYGLYIILKVAQDIPGEIENKTIDLVLSKPIKRWEYVLGKQLQHITTIFAVIGFSALCTVGAIAINPNVNLVEVDIGGFIICFVWLGVLLFTIESAVLLISTILGSKKARSVGFTIVMGLWFISAYSGSIPIENIEYISFFTFFDTRTILIDGIFTETLGNVLILIAYSVILSIIAIVYFSKRDILV